LVARANLTSMVERQTRFTVLLHNPSRQSGALVEKIGRALQAFPQGVCRTITFDRGTEFAAYARLTETIGWALSRFRISEALTASVWIEVARRSTSSRGW
jgi:IS30 family transposase